MLRNGMPSFLFVSLRHTVRLRITWAESNRKPGVIPSAPTELCSTGALTHKITSGGANHIPASVCFMTKGILLGIVTHTYWIALQVYEKENKPLLQPHFQSGLTSTLFCPYHGFSFVKGNNYNACLVTLQLDSMWWQIFLLQNSSVEYEVTKGISQVCARMRREECY